MMDQAQTFDAARHIPFDDGRGLYPDRIQTAAPVGLRSQIREVAASHGMSAAAFIREAIQERLRQAASPSNTAEA